MTNCLSIVLTILVGFLSVTTLLSESSVVESINTTPTSQIPSPDFEQDVLFRYLMTDCELPCWNSLEIGTATEEVFLNQLRTLNMSSRPYNNLPITELNYDYWRQIESQRIFQDENAFRFSVIITGYFNDNLLRGLFFEWSDFSLYQMTFKHIFQQLGQPSNIYIFYDVTRGKIIWLEYSDLDTDFIYFTQNTTQTSPFEFCTMTSHWINYGTLLVFITDNTSKDIRESQIDRVIVNRNDLHRLENVSEFTSDTFTEAALKSDFCFEVDEDMVVLPDE